VTSEPAIGGHTGPVRALRIVVLAALVLMLFGGRAAAQVVIDPDSPSAKEYAIPLESERRQADPAVQPQDGVVHGERSSPLFGEGIEPAGREKRSDSASGSDASGGSDGTAAPAASGDSPRRTAQPEVVRIAASSPGAPDGGIGTALTVAGVALAVLLIGGGAGLLARRRT
jgi:hypothetical protein